MTKVRIQITMGDVTDGFQDYETLDIEATNAAYAAEYERRIRAEYPDAEVTVTAEVGVSCSTDTNIRGVDFDEREAIDHNLNLIAEALVEDQDAWLVKKTA